MRSWRPSTRICALRRQSAGRQTGSICHDGRRSATTWLGSGSHSSSLGAAAWPITTRLVARWLDAIRRLKRIILL